jgi:hypothetical protein
VVAEQRTPTRESIKRLRNLELREGYRLSRKRTRFALPGSMQIHKDGKITFHREDGGEIDIETEALTLTESTTVWDFNVPGVQDRPVKDVLDTACGVLSQQVLPEAERLLRATD